MADDWAVVRPTEMTVMTIAERSKRAAAADSYRARVDATAGAAAASSCDWFLLVT